jgi:hypothetical protein
MPNLPLISTDQHTYHRPTYQDLSHKYPMAPSDRAVSRKNQAQMKRGLFPRRALLHGLRGLDPRERDARGIYRSEWVEVVERVRGGSEAMRRARGPSPRFSEEGSLAVDSEGEETYLVKIETRLFHDPKYPIRRRLCGTRSHSDVWRLGRDSPLTEHARLFPDCRSLFLILALRPSTKKHNRFTPDTAYMLLESVKRSPDARRGRRKETEPPCFCWFCGCREGKGDGFVGVYRGLIGC